MRAITLALVVALLEPQAMAQDVGKEIRSIYSFAPHKLTSQEIDAKSKMLDTFWAKAKSQRDTYLPVLRTELKRPEGPPFFLYDGSMLLLSISDTGPDRKIALNAISRCDLRDVQHTDYFRQVHRLASHGEDTTEAALHILAEPKFKVFIPQHALTLGQDYALVYMLLPSDPALWLPKIIARLGSEKDPTAQKSLLLLTWYAQTTETDAALKAFSEDTDKSSERRNYARELLSRKSGLSNKVTSMIQSVETIRSERREVMKRVSDEALIELDQLTAQIIVLRK